MSALSLHGSQLERFIQLKNTNQRVRKLTDYHGALFFASINTFHSIFNPKEDPDNVYIDFEDSRVIDHSAIQAIDKLAERYQKAGKTLHLMHLSEECRLLLKTAQHLVEVNVLEDPQYHVAIDKAKARIEGSI